MKGAKFSEGGESATFKQDYLEIPVLARLTFPMAPGSALRPSVFAGPALGIELSCEIELQDGNVSADFPCDDSMIGLDSKTMDFGLVFGGELGIDRGGMRIGLEARYNLGLTSFDDTGNDADLKHRAFSIMATIAFGG